MVARFDLGISFNRRRFARFNSIFPTLILLSVCATLLSACVSNLRGDGITDQSVISQIQPGTSTPADVLRLLGQPVHKDISNLPTTDALWNYHAYKQNGVLVQVAISFKDGNVSRIDTFHTYKENNITVTRRLDPVLPSTRGSQPWLGMSVKDLPDDAAQQGITITRIIPNGPAEKAGLKTGDKITHFDSVAVFDSDGLRLRLNRKTSGTRVFFRVIRGSASKEFPLILTSKK